MPVYRRARGKYRVKVYHRGVPYERIVNGTRKEALAYESRFRAELEVADPRERRSAPTLSAFCVGEYAAYGATHLAASTWDRRTYQIANLTERIGHLKLTEIVTERVVEYQALRKAEGVMPRTVNNECKVLGAVLRYAREIGVPCASPRIRMLPTQEGRHSRPLSTEEVERLISTAWRLEPWLAPLVVFLANTGARKSEALGMRPADVDLQRGLVRIWPRGEEQRTKEGKPKEVPISPSLWAWLCFLLNQPWLFPGKRGGRLTEFPKGPYRRVEKAAGLSGGPHVLRHTFASHFLATVPDLHLLATLMGHSYERTTQLYSHMLGDRWEKARGAVDFGGTVARTVAGDPGPK